MSLKRIFGYAFVGGIVLSCNFALAQDSTNVANGVTGPKIKFAETSYDFGTAAQATQVKHIFEFDNVGTDTLKIARVKTSCGCTAAESSKIIAPQEGGQIAVTYSTGSHSGKVSKTVYVFSNDVEEPRRKISIHGIVEPKKADEKSEE